MQKILMMKFDLMERFNGTNIYFGGAMEGLEITINELSQRVDQLLLVNRALRSELEVLRQETPIGTEQKNTDALPSTPQFVANIARSASDAESNEDQRTRLTELVREIDKCIELLTN